MSGNATDLALIDTINRAAPENIADVIAVMTAIDAILPSNDGLKWFNWLYLTVTMACTTIRRQVDSIIRNGLRDWT
jgi:hypothetical protein